MELPGGSLWLIKTASVVSLQYKMFTERDRGMDNEIHRPNILIGQNNYNVSYVDCGVDKIISSI